MNDFLIDIDRYLDNEMSASEKLTFEKRIAEDADLYDALKLQQDMRLLYSQDQWIEGNKAVLKEQKAGELRTFLSGDEAQGIKNMISDVIQENKSVSKTPKLSWWIGIAAAVALLITVSTVFFKNNSSEDLYSQYIDLDAIPSLVTRGEHAVEELQSAQLLFEEQKYQEAIPIFEKHQHSSDIVNPLTYIYTGIAYMQVGKYEKALLQFDQLRKSDTLQSKKADWYTAMVYLKQNEQSKLKELLSKITSNTSNYKYKQALELLDSID